MATKKAVTKTKLSSQTSTSLDLSDLKAAVVLDDKDVVRGEGVLWTIDRVKLRWRSWEPASQTIKAVVVLTHGYGEHSARYDHIAVGLTRAGYAVMAMDVRGHGLSTGIRAHVDKYSDYVRDLDIIRRHASKTWCDKPVFCLGHSNGGLITLMYALTKPSGIEGFVVTSPLCGIRTSVPFVKALAGDLMSKVWPSFSLPSGLDPAHISRDSFVVQAYKQDKLVQSVATARWFTEAKKAMNDIYTRAGEISQPFLFLVAGDDHIVDCNKTIKIFHRLGSRDREMEVYPEHYHEILNEKTWPDILTRIVAWMDKRLG